MHYLFLNYLKKNPETQISYRAGVENVWGDQCGAGGGWSSCVPGARGGEHLAPATGPCQGIQFLGHGAKVRLSPGEWHLAVARARWRDPGDLLPFILLFPIFQLTEALAYLHYSGHVIHRNVCPSSILITKRGIWKLAGMEYVGECSLGLVVQNWNGLARSAICIHIHIFGLQREWMRTIWTAPFRVRHGAIGCPRWPSRILTLWVSRYRLPISFGLLILLKKSVNVSIIYLGIRVNINVVSSREISFE